jgi:hypothetical protein
MGTYDDWNRALFLYFTEGLPRGSGVFLTVDDDALRAAGKRLLTVQLGTDATADFLDAVRRRVVRGGYRVNVASLNRPGADGVPDGLGFLCSMVLAAARMADQGEISQINYFRRLRNVLGLADAGGRPPGMEGGAEEAVWQAWNRYLRGRGFVPTARRGDDEPHKFVNYPISQTLLRRADKDRLFRLFADKGWVADWDAETVLARVRQETARLTQHLRDDLLRGRGDRLLAVAEAIHDLYSVWKESPDLDRLATGSLGRSLTIIAGLLRIPDPIFDVVGYYVYPRTPRGRGIDRIVVRDGDAARVLRVDRQGWFEILGEATESAIDNGWRYPIEEPEELAQLVLPRRDFWVLVPDPEDPESGVYATWGRPPLGTPFVVLCRGYLLHQLDHLRRERLIDYVDAPQPVMSSGSWHEVRHCMVVSSAWSGVFIENREFLDALKPIVALSIGLDGGIRMRGATGWLCGYGPAVTVFGFETAVDLIVFDEDDIPVYETSSRANVQLDVPWPEPGTYRIEARSSGATAERLVAIWRWDDLRIAEVPDRHYLPLGDYRLCGAALERRDGGPV